MSDIRMLDELGAELARVARSHERPARPARRLRAVAVALGAALLLGGAAVAVPETRAAIEDITSSFSAWVAGDEAAAPGRALQPGEDAPAWVLEGKGRLIAEKEGAGLYVMRHGDYLDFAVGAGFGEGDTIDGWRTTFAEHKLIVLGPGSFGDRTWDRHGRFALMDLTARSVDRLELTYESGPPLAERGLRGRGGFVLLVDARRPLRELTAYDRAGHELERKSMGYIDLSRVCHDERGCPPGPWEYPPE
jgi:hypothetical protein